ncbi:MAG: arginine--tRNA ligase [Candidatus Kerfeldbacteria bacterium]|nr:arginine--tRNA ligase [Candidatus Kerfeldbacteria bacterium]
MHFKNYIAQKIERVVRQRWPELDDLPRIDLAYPPEERFGDYTTTLALQLAPRLKMNPLEIAKIIIADLGKISAVRQMSVVAPGFINFFLDSRWLARQVGEITLRKTAAVKIDVGHGQRVVVEYVSANPTGPVTMANGRGAFSGDTLSRVLRFTGYRVKREYYLNDVGNQVNILAESVLRRYWINQGIKMEYPDYCYQGDYVSDLARRINVPNYTLQNAEKIQEIKDKIKGRILTKMVVDIERLLEKKLNVHYDTWFSEKSLYTSGLVDRTLQQLKELRLLFKFEGAIWLKMKDAGEKQDHVLIKADEQPTYFLSEIAYLYDKFIRRKIDRYIWLIGADHHGHAQRIKTAHRMLGLPGIVDVILMQFVRLIRNGEEVKMSKRAGTFVTLEELVDEVGVDAARYFFLMHDFNSHMDFDLNLAKKQSKDNPVYYVQYAHTRICSILKKAKSLKTDGTQLLPKETHPSEVRLIKQLIRWPELLTDVAVSYQVHRLPTYATELATAFHDFYTQCRVIDGATVIGHRQKLVRATQIILQHVLATMGITAPENM